MRVIPGHPRYLISDDGAVLGPRNRFLAGYMDRDGYRRVRLHSGEASAVKGVHWLVCLAFHGAPPVGHVPCHKDGVKVNNSASNLRWGTQRDNWADRRLHGTDVDGERNGRARLKGQDVARIRHLLLAGEKQVNLAKQFGVTQATISKIRLRKIWN
jgi:hypothetical protein